MLELLKLRAGASQCEHHCLIRGYETSLGCLEKSFAAVVPSLFDPENSQEKVPKFMTSPNLSTIWGETFGPK
jgi:hypothetical protein